MSKFTEAVLDNWRKPLSETEEQKISNAISMIKDAVRAHSDLSKLDIEFIVQGSYGNNTNIKLDSDIDVCVMLKNPFYTLYRNEATDKDYGLVSVPPIYDSYKKHIIEALELKFGRENIKPGNKAIYIESNTYRVHSDVVPAILLRDYRHETKNNVGLILYNNLNELPISDLKEPDGNANLPLEKIETIIEYLATISDVNHKNHDGFHLISSEKFHLTHISQYFSTPIVKNVELEFHYGSRYRTAFYGSFLPGVSACGVLSKNYGPTIFVKGKKVEF